MRWLVLCSALIPLALSPFGSANALSYIWNRTDWLGMSNGTKTGYVMGIIDDVTSPVLWKSYPNPDSKDPGFYRYIISLSWKNCILDKKISSKELVIFVDNEYSSGSSWDLTPYEVLSNKVANICRSHLEAERRRFGLN